MPNPKREPTPGPWFFDENQVGCASQPYFGIAHANSSSHRICHPALVPFHGYDDEEARANARLIAASPDLLRAAEFTVEHFIKHGRIVGTLAIESLTAAVAKARGDE